MPEATQETEAVMQAMVKMREDYPEVRKLLRNELEWKYGSRFISRMGVGPAVES